jgi:hypothetical protein
MHFDMVALHYAETFTGRLTENVEPKPGLD